MRLFTEGSQYAQLLAMELTEYRGQIVFLLER